MNNLKEINIKNHPCYYFDDITKIEDFDFDNTLFDEKTYENVLAYGSLCKTLIGTKLLLIWFDKVDEFIRVYDRARYLVLFRPENYDISYKRIKH